VTTADLAAFKDPLDLTVQARARLPVDACDMAEIVAFRARDDMREHVALVIGTQSGDVVPLVPAAQRMPDRRRARQPQV